MKDKRIYVCEKCKDLFNHREAVEHSIKKKHYSFKINGTRFALNVG
jgi:hypothetical protein